MLLRDEHMTQDNLPSQESLVLKFHGDSSMDAAILGRSILNMALIAKEVVSIEGVSDDFDVRVKPFEEGCFDVIFLVLHQAAKALAPHLTLQNAQSLIATIKSFFETKKLLRGEKPKSIEQFDNHVKLTLSNDVVYEGPPLAGLVFKHTKIDGLVSEVSELALSNKGGEGFSLIDSSGENFYSNQDAKDIAIRQEFPEFSESESIRSERVTLPVKSPVLLGDAGWRFQYGSRSITASIDDLKFMNDVHSRKIAMQSGDELDVDLETTTKKSPSGEIANVSHKITKVHRFVQPPRSEQTRLPEV